MRECAYPFAAFLFFSAFTGQAAGTDAIQIALHASGIQATDTLEQRIIKARI